MAPPQGKSSDILPVIRTMPLAKASLKRLFSRAVRLFQPGSGDFESAIKWIHSYSRAAVFARMKRNMRQKWDHDEEWLKRPPSEHEIEVMQRRCREAGIEPGDVRSDLVAERALRLKKLATERKRWRPNLRDRLMLAVEDASKAPWPDSANEHAERSRRLLVLANLLIWPEPIPELGEFGSWRWNTRETMLDKGKEGRGEVLFVLYPEGRRISSQFPLRQFRRALAIAVDEVEHLERHATTSNVALLPPEDRRSDLPTPPSVDVTPQARRGRLTRADSEAKHAALLATLVQHPSMKDDLRRLAESAGVSESTARRWLAAEEEKYRQSIAVGPASNSVCISCKDSLSGTSVCEVCGKQLTDECAECHGEKAHGKITPG